MGSKWKPRQLVESKPRNYSAKGMIEAGTGKGRPMRDRRERRSKENLHDIDRIDMLEDESFYDEQSEEG